MVTGSVPRHEAYCAAVLFATAERPPNRWATWAARRPVGGRGVSPCSSSAARQWRQHVQQIVCTRGRAAVEEPSGLQIIKSRDAVSEPVLLGPWSTHFRWNWPRDEVRVPKGVTRCKCPCAAATAGAAATAAMPLQRCTGGG